LAFIGDSFGYVFNLSRKVALGIDSDNDYSHVQCYQLEMKHSLREARNLLMPATIGVLDTTKGTTAWIARELLRRHITGQNDLL
jgi:hypothetical protein